MNWGEQVQAAPYKRFVIGHSRRGKLIWRRSAHTITFLYMVCPAQLAHFTAFCRMPRVSDSLEMRPDIVPTRVSTITRTASFCPERPSQSFRNPHTYLQPQNTRAATVKHEYVCPTGHWMRGRGTFFRTRHAPSCIVKVWQSNSIG